MRAASYAFSSRVCDQYVSVEFMHSSVEPSLTLCNGGNKTKLAFVAPTLLTMQITY